MSIPLEKQTEFSDAARGKRLDRSRRDRVHTHALRAIVVGEIFDAGFERRLGDAHDVIMRDDLLRAIIAERQQRAAALRSEEHTSELQSLMRISSAVFCLKKKDYT